MIDIKFLRLHYVLQILRTMDSEFEIINESEILVDDHKCHIWLSEDNPSGVLMHFDPKVDVDYGTNLVLRFGCIAELLGLEVESGHDNCPDFVKTKSRLKKG
jgi:hypothetical protein